MINTSGSPDLTKDQSLGVDKRFVNLKTNLKKLIADKNINAIKLSKATGVPKSTLSDWLLGNSPKNITQVKAVAEYFNVSIDELVFSDSKKKSMTTEKSDSELLMFGNFDVYLKKKN